MGNPYLKFLIGSFFFGFCFLPISTFCREFSDVFFKWATAPSPPGTLTRKWLLANLEPALHIVALYFSLIAFGTIFKKSNEDEKVPAAVERVVKFFQLIYNLVQCVLCTYMIWKAIQEYQQSGYSLVCNKFDVNRGGMASVLYIFYLSKILDFCDTVFILFRKKWRQLSFLHVYHHSSIFLVYWMNLNVAYDGDIYLTIVLNSFVHLVMYSYYLLATLSIQVPWKNYITLLQMGQFLLMNAQAIYLLYFKCPFPRNVTFFYLFYIISLFILFQNFYKKTYTPKSNSKKND